MKKTKIVCSIGPSSVELETFSKMVEAGMNVARINFSHETEEGCEKVVHLVEEVNKQGNHIAIMYDTKGPDFRTGALMEENVELKEGETIQLVKEDILGTASKISVNYKSAIDTIPVHSIILIEDGLFKLEVIDKDSESLTCRILVGGSLGAHKGINVPGVDLEEPFLSEIDKKDITYACKHEGDFIALSFVSCKEDVLSVRKLIEENGSTMQIISKIEAEYEEINTQLAKQDIENREELENKKQTLEEMRINMQFLGLDLSKVPMQNLGDWKIYVIPVLYVITSFVSIKITTSAQKKAMKKKEVIIDENGKEASDDMLDSMQQMNNSMLYMMPIMSISIAVIAPLGLALYWLVSNILMIIERLMINKFIGSKEEEEDA